MSKLRIAVQGCCHGELNAIFNEVNRLNNKEKIDLLIILGDFQSLRSRDDFNSISIPPKYQKLGDFRQYYIDSNKRAPVPTIFIGGNHESMKHLMLLPYGGYAANEIYYLGYSNVIWFKGVRIGSLSGIYKKWDVDRVRPNYSDLERFNTWQKNVRNLYHVRKHDLVPLFMIRQNVDLMLSHDWPSGVVYYGDMQRLLKFKPFFKNDIQAKELGSPLNWQLLKDLQPKWWLSAHLHCRYEARIRHTKRKTQEDTNVEKRTVLKNNAEIDLGLSSDEDTDAIENKQSTGEMKQKGVIQKNSAEISLDLSSDEEHASTTNTLGHIQVPGNENPTTTEEDKEILYAENSDHNKDRIDETVFLSLDKCLPRRKWLEIIEVDANEKHPSYKSDNVYWDCEFIRNLQYLEKHKEKIRERPFNTLNWHEMIKERSIGLNNDEEIDWSNFIIPRYEFDIQKKEVEQTRFFKDKFLRLHK
ncbi:RNA lariat debranching enzyme NDAI_0C03820 [Naumovozyma dairenensis CBS 421]|uniref:Lariat debranching enzyme C-terminal domain-containing protein n=1 Tax=Naumovozyma dairenensis (strain ATCC 10597 / BCRC 20456 / CBS 421 / NBRC 0211 / NRRL Y-12639) TaxID=1071378 RepID=G0W8D1_NAUDC|nr:hypothetical protein NDAI_0C03820 [Naumovozyma dairenensis CBS 421]CCD24042.1 hypothetical protein NDAI_0C03820 [Naumovozyma dairenensis CBS 421]